jgi:hypothetical protein
MHLRSGYSHKLYLEILEDRSLPNNLLATGGVLGNGGVGMSWPDITADNVLAGGSAPSPTDVTLASSGPTLLDLPRPAPDGGAAAAGPADAGSVAVSSGNNDGPNPGILPPQSHPYGATYGEWAARWWQWAFSLPAEHHPLFDTAPLSTGQEGHVWFLGGTFTGSDATRTGTVPAGTGLFFPIANFEDSTIEEGNPNATLAQLRAVAQEQLDAITGLFASIDGRAVRNVTDYREQSRMPLI